MPKYLLHDEPYNEFRAKANREIPVVVLEPG